MKNLYKNFYDPTKRFKKIEPRAFCYDLAQELLKKSKDESTDWYVSEKTIEGILLLLFCWNFAARKTKRLNKDNIRELLERCLNDLQRLKKISITDFDTRYDSDDIKTIQRLYKEFKDELGQTGASKALSLLNPALFVMWDTKIRRELKKIIKGISNGENPTNYINFLIGIRKIIDSENLEERINKNDFIAKKIDEYHYVEIVKK